MVITKAPLRISLLGGTTDIPAVYNALGYGAVLSFTINKFVYAIMKKTFSPQGVIRVSYAEHETVQDVSEIKNDLIRSVVSELDLHASSKDYEGLEIITISDVPSRGTGLGASSALCVALLKAGYQMKGIPCAGQQHRIAQEACRIEIDVMGKPIGKQDQFAASYEGFNLFRFYSEDHGSEVSVLPLDTNLLKLMYPHMHLFFLEHRNPQASDTILRDVRIDLGAARELLVLTEEAARLYRYGHLDAYLPEFLREGWKLKKCITPKTTNPRIDSIMSELHERGGSGKVLGAGQGGFLFVYTEDTKVVQWCKDTLGPEMPFEVL